MLKIIIDYHFSLQLFFLPSLIAAFCECNLSHFSFRYLVFLLFSCGDYFFPGLITSTPPDTMSLYLCLHLLVVLLQPAVGTYNCSSNYQRTPGGFL